jgi:hypothetical protein
MTYEQYCVGGDAAELDAIFASEASSDFTDPSGISRETLCANCVSDGYYVSRNKAVDRRVKVMTPSDWATYYFVTVLTSFVVVIETQDIMYTRLLARSAGKISVWNLLIGLMNVLRNFVLMPIVVWSVAESVLYFGTFPTSMILNTVAALALVVLNISAFWLVLSAPVRQEVQRFGKPLVNEKTSQLIVCSAILYMLSIQAVMLVKVALKDSISNNTFSSKWIQSAIHQPYGIEITFYPFILVPFFEAVWETIFDRNFYNLPLLVVRLIGGWLLLNLYLYYLYDYSFRPEL